jgi:hypothetical protein
VSDVEKHFSNGQGRVQRLSCGRGSVRVILPSCIEWVSGGETPVSDFEKHFLKGQGVYRGHPSGIDRGEAAKSSATYI